VGFIVERKGWGDGMSIFWVRVFILFLHVVVTCDKHSRQSSITICGACATIFSLIALDDLCEQLTYDIAGAHRGEGAEVVVTCISVV